MSEQVKVYPTIQEVENASREQLCSWYRFLPSPGQHAIGKGQDEFDAAIAGEKPVMDRLVERFREMGGMTPEISKNIGW